MEWILSMIADFSKNSIIYYKYKSYYRIIFNWKDMRFIEGNEGRNTSCPSKQVAWTSDDQFWLPQLDIWDAIELARFVSCIETY